MKRIFVYHRSTHHAKNSGYTHLLDYFTADIIPNTNSREYISYTIRKKLAPFFSDEYGIYDTQSIEKEWQLKKNIRKEKNIPTIIHYLNVERDVRFIPVIYKNKKYLRFTGTFHYPPQVLEKIITNPKYLKNIHGSIAVGPNQVSFLKEWLGSDKVKFIPHGVDTSFFCPTLEKESGTRLLFVGQHMRDFDALNYAIPRIMEKIPDVTFQIVLHKAYIQKIENHPCNVEIYFGISDEHLRILYQNASLLFLPLKDSTACNSLLEALACGLPIVTTNIGGNYGYLDESCSKLVEPKDLMSLIDVSIDLLKSPDLLTKMGFAAREKSINYSWQNVAKVVSSFHQSLFNEN